MTPLISLTPLISRFEVKHTGGVALFCGVNPSAPPNGSNNPPSNSAWNPPSVRVVARGDPRRTWTKWTCPLFRPPNGLVADNLRIHDNTGLPVVVANAPGGWKPPVNLTQKNNRNHLSDRAKEQPPVSALEK